jgi:cobalamin biosynthetic protein CobC
MNLAKPEHGGALAAAIARHGGEAGDWLDISTGIAPRPFPLPRMAAATWTRLPDADALQGLLDAARTAYRVREQSGIVAAPGTQALIEALPRILPGNTATVVSPAAGTYREHAHCCAKAGRGTSEAESLAQATRREQSLVILVRPNNPDASLAPMDEVLSTAERLARTGGTLVVDEAFCDTLPGESAVMAMPENLVVLRSFGKFFGLAGLRLGFAIGSPAICRALEDQLGPWAVSGPAIAAGTVALRDAGWIDGQRRYLAARRRAAENLLSRHGLEIAGAHDLFVLARHPAASVIGEELAKRQVLVRTFADRPGLMRFGMWRAGRDHARLDAALGDAMREAGRARR